VVTGAAGFIGSHLCECLLSDGFKIYNLGESRPISVNDLIVRLEKALGKRAVREYLARQPGDVERTYADVSRAVRELGYNPATTIRWAWKSSSRG
jgi:UDP-glucuronate 4-epimerase